MTKTKIPQKLHATSPDLVGYTLGEFHDGQIRITIKFDGTLNEAALAKAVRHSLDAEPVLGCQFVRKPLRPFWQRCSNLQDAYEFRIVDASEREKAVNSYLLAPLNPFEGTQIRVALIRSNYDTLIIKMTHIVGDGVASFEYLQLLSRLYRNLLSEPTYQPRINLHGSRSFFQLLRHISPLRLASSLIHISVPKTAWKMPAEEHSTNIKPHLLIRRVGSKQLSNLKAYAKSQHATLGDVLTTAYYRTLFQTFNPPERSPLPLFLPVNLRKTVPKFTAQSICMLSASYFIEVTHRKDESFEETLTKVHCAMEQEKNKHSEVGYLLFIQLALLPGYVVPKLLRRTLSSVALIPEFSNLGVVDASCADFGVPVQDVLSSGPAMYAPHFCLGASTFNDELILTATIVGTDEYRARIETLLDALIRDLP